MQFDPNLHQKVRFEGSLYAVIRGDFPELYHAGDDYTVVIHPLNAQNWITHNTNPAMQEQFSVQKGQLQFVGPAAKA